MNEVIITDAEVSVGYITPQERLKELGARIVSYETSERWVIDGKLVYIERAPIDWRKNLTARAMQ